LLINRFGIDDPDLGEGGNLVKQRTLKDLLKNDSIPKSNEKNIYHRDKEIYGYMFIYDISKPESVEQVKMHRKCLICSSEILSISLLIMKKRVLLKSQPKKFLLEIKLVCIFWPNFIVDLRPDDKEPNKKGKKKEQVFDQVDKVVSEIVNTYRIPFYQCSAYENNNVTQVFLAFYSNLISALKS
jgi:hypothetical protein